MTALSAILGMLVVLILLPVTVLLVQVPMALPAHRPRLSPQGKRFSMGVFIPAHNEVAVIAATLSSIFSQHGEGDRRLVVADNCSDETATIHGVAIPRADSNISSNMVVRPAAGKYAASRSPVQFSTEILRYCLCMCNDHRALGGFANMIHGRVS